MEDSLLGFPFSVLCLLHCVYYIIYTLMQHTHFSLTLYLSIFIKVSLSSSLSGHSSLYMPLYRHPSIYTVSCMYSFKSLSPLSLFPILYIAPSHFISLCITHLSPSLPESFFLSLSLHLSLSLSLSHSLHPF